MADEAGVVHAGSGWTNLDDHPRAAASASSTGCITGWHDPDASHLLMLEAIGGDAIRRAYAALAPDIAGTSSGIRI